MKDRHLTLRLAAELARALARRARERGVPKSQLAREAVGAYLVAPAAPDSVAPRHVTAREVAGRWREVPRLAPEEADDFAADLAAARAALRPAVPPWE